MGCSGSTQTGGTPAKVGPGTAPVAPTTGTNVTESLVESFTTDAGETPVAASQREGMPKPVSPVPTVPKGAWGDSPATKAAHAKGENAHTEGALIIDNIEDMEDAPSTPTSRAERRPQPAPMPKPAPEPRAANVRKLESKQSQTMPNLYAASPQPTNVVQYVTADGRIETMEMEDLDPDDKPPSDMPVHHLRRGSYGALIRSGGLLAHDMTSSFSNLSRRASISKKKGGTERPADPPPPSRPVVAHKKRGSFSIM